MTMKIGAAAGKSFLSCASARMATMTLTTTAAAVHSHPSHETGVQPHPRTSRRGANHSFSPTSGRTLTREILADSTVDARPQWSEKWAAFPCGHATS